MAAYVTSAPAPLGAISVYRVVQSVDHSIHVLSTWNTRRATRNALHKLSNRELDDIGLCRGDIDLLGR